MFSNISNLENILYQSLNDVNPVRNVIDSNNKQVEIITYDPNTVSQESCCITMEDLKVGEKIAKLPCNHCFNKEAIMEWLTTEKAECPICRFKLDSVEKVEAQSEPEEKAPEQPSITQNITNINNNITINNEFSSGNEPLSRSFQIFNSIMDILSYDPYANVEFNNTNNYNNYQEANTHTVADNSATVASDNADNNTMDSNEEEKNPETENYDDMPPLMVPDLSGNNIISIIDNYRNFLQNRLENMSSQNTIMGGVQYDADFQQAIFDSLNDTSTDNTLEA